MNTYTATPPAANADIDLIMNDAWDSAAVANLIHANTTPGTSPAYLFLGSHEVSLLRQHLGAAFGEASIVSLKLLYYMGLEVVEIDKPRFLRVAGRKVTRLPLDPSSRRTSWRDRETDSLWSLRIT